VKGNIRYIKAEGVYTLLQLKTLLSSEAPCLTQEQMEWVYSTLLAANDTTITKEEHVRAIRETQDKIAHNICPRCGKTLVLRNGRNGKFYGCAGYPDCRFTKNI
jgi:predicted RNA-binding Zn-ribbon protein involved in translation (DUF1610 family)